MNKISNYLKKNIETEFDFYVETSIFTLKLHKNSINSTYFYENQSLTIRSRF